MGAPIGMAVAQRDCGLLEFVGGTAMRMMLGIALLVAAGCGGDAAQTHPIPGDRGPAITVEVLNANGGVGDVRIGTKLLRRAGMDVVYFGNASENGLDSTRIIVRRGAGFTNSFPTKPARESFCGDILFTYAYKFMECE